MARPKMNFKPEVAFELAFAIHQKLEDYDFCDSHLVKGGYGLHSEAREAFTPLWSIFDKAASWRANPVPVTEDGCKLLQQWLQTFMTEQGWKRLLAAMRQKKSSRKKRNGPYLNIETSVALPRGSSYELGNMAQELGLDKKDLLSRLPNWFMWDDNGRVAFKAFSATVRTEQVNKGRKLLEEVFQLSTHKVNTLVFEAAGLDRERERELHRFACLAGKPRLVTLAKALKKLDAQEQLKTLVTVTHQYRLLIELAAKGEMAEVLGALGATGAAEDPLAADVAAIEQSLQGKGVAAVADLLSAAVPKDADFGKFKNSQDNE